MVAALTRPYVFIEKRKISSVSSGRLVPEEEDDFNVRYSEYIGRDDIDMPYVSSET
jgi:hypothetical protein